MNNRGDVGPVSPDLLSDDGTFSTLEVSPEQKAREFFALRSGGLEPTPKSDGKEVLYSDVGKQVATDDGKEGVVGLGFFPEPRELEGNHRKTIFGLPKWGFWSIVAVVALVVIALAVGSGAGISIHNKDRNDAALAASKESSSLAAAHSSTITSIPTNIIDDTLASSTSTTGSRLGQSRPSLHVATVSSYMAWVPTFGGLPFSQPTCQLWSSRIANSYTGINFTQNITQYVNVSDFGFATTATSSQNWVEYTIVNQRTDTAFLSTQTNYFEDLQYYWKTVSINNSIPSNGTGNFGPTECNQVRSSPSGTFVATTGTVPTYSYLPGASIVYYTTLVPFDSTFNDTDWESVGLSILGDRLSVVINQVFGTTCSYYGGGVATIQVAVEQILTVTSTAVAVAARKVTDVASETTLAKASFVRRSFEDLIPSPTASGKV